MNRIIVASLAITWFGCGTPASKQPPTAEPPPRIEPSDAASAPPVDASNALPIIADAMTPDAAVGPTVEVAGEGTCTTDADCVLSSYQEGCCTQGCQNRAMNGRDLAARQTKENCEVNRPKLCPPPAPCPVPTHAVVSAKCSKRKCVSLQRKLP